MPHITKENARELQLRSAQSRAANRKADEERAAELRAQTLLTPRDRLRLAASETLDQAVDRMRELLAGGDAETAVRTWLQMYDRAEPKPAQQLEVKAGPLGDLAEVSTAELQQRLAELQSSADSSGGSSVSGP